MAAFDGYLRPDFVKELIERYKNLPCLWDINCNDYNDGNKKEEAYIDLLSVAKKFYPDSTIDFVQSKIHNLRKAFKKEFRKVKACEEAGASGNIVDIYVPKLWYYDSMLFLKDSIQESKNPNHQSKSVSNLHSSMKINSDIEVSDDDREANAEKRRKRKKREELLKLAETILKKHDPELDAYAMIVASKLRQMERMQRIHAENLINDILCHGIMGKLREGW